jgi:peptide/nickel transport system substrate-binding protein
MPAETQLLNVQRGANEIAVDLSSEQAKPLRHDHKVRIKETPSPNVFFMFANLGTKVSPITPNVHFERAIRYAINYQTLKAIGGPGTVQAAGMIPYGFLGSLPASKAIHQNLTKAKAELAASGIKNPTVTLGYPSDETLDGLSETALAESVQADLSAIGIHVTLQGSPTNLAFAQYRNGKEQLGMWTFGPDYPDPIDYLAFLPGGYVGVRVNWKTGDDRAISALGRKMADTGNPSLRAKRWQHIQTILNQTGPYFPLVQPAEVMASTSNLTHVAYNAVWTLNLGSIGSR